jgi:hypothetical protein
VIAVSEGGFNLLEASVGWERVGAEMGASEEEVLDAGPKGVEAEEGCEDAGGAKFGAWEEG